MDRGNDHRGAAAPAAPDPIRPLILLTVDLPSLYVPHVRPLITHADTDQWVLSVGGAARSWSAKAAHDIIVTRPPACRVTVVEPYRAGGRGPRVPCSSLALSSMTGSSLISRKQYCTVRVDEPAPVLLQWSTGQALAFWTAKVTLAELRTMPESAGQRAMSPGRGRRSPPGRIRRASAAALALVEDHRPRQCRPWRLRRTRNSNSGHLAAVSGRPTPRSGRRSSGGVRPGAAVRHAGLYAQAWTSTFIPPGSAETSTVGRRRALVTLKAAGVGLVGLAERAHVGREAGRVFISEDVGQLSALRHRRGDERDRSVASLRSRR